MHDYIKMMSEDTELEWHKDALCAQTDPEMFFPEGNESTKEAKKICGQCSVRGDCLEYALKNSETYGIWGGLTTGERARLRRTKIGARSIGRPSAQKKAEHDKLITAAGYGRRR